MSSVPHDYAAQRGETYAVWDDIGDSSDLPDVADIDYVFAPQDSADWDAAETALSAAGYECARAEDDDGAPYLAASLPDQPLTAMAVWLGEETATRAVLEHGFRPDGWGFLA